MSVHLQNSSKLISPVFCTPSPRLIHHERENLFTILISWESHHVTFEYLFILFFNLVRWPVRTISFNHTGEYIASASEDLFIDIVSMRSTRFLQLRISIFFIIPFQYLYYSLAIHTACLITNAHYVNTYDAIQQSGLTIHPLLGYSITSDVLQKCYIKSHAGKNDPHNWNHVSIIWNFLLWSSMYAKGFHSPMFTQVEQSTRFRVEQPWTV